MSPYNYHIVYDIQHTLCTTIYTQKLKLRRRKTRRKLLVYLMMFLFETSSSQFHLAIGTITVSS